MDFSADATVACSPGSANREAELEQLVAQLQGEIRLLKEKVHYLLHKQFGRSAESDPSIQPGLFDVTMPVPVTELEAAPAPAKLRAKGGRRLPPKDLPRQRIVHELPEQERLCGCGACRQPIGEETSEQYDVVPPVFQVLEHVRIKYACPVCQAGVQVAPKSPLGPLPRTQVSPGPLAWLGVGKFVDGLPLYRQSVVLEKRFGVAFNRTTLSSWLI